jgi:hypothetical protein
MSYRSDMPIDNCQKCGIAAVVRRTPEPFYGPTRGWFVACPGCGSRGLNYLTPDEAVDRWNKELLHRGEPIESQGAKAARVFDQFAALQRESAVMAEVREAGPPRVVDYQIVCHANRLLVADSVRVLRAEGWQPQGGVAMALADGALWFAQAIVKYEETEGETEADHE